MAIQRIRIYNPTSRPKPREASTFQPHQLSDLRGKSLVVLSNGWPTWQKMLDRLVSVLSERYAPLRIATYKIPSGSPAEPKLLETAAKEGDFAIVGIGN